MRMVSSLAISVDSGKATDVRKCELTDSDAGSATQSAARRSSSRAAATKSKRRAIRDDDDEDEDEDMEE